jgi:hypothetical protein
MPKQVNVVNGIASSPLMPGDQFAWVNPTEHPVSLSGCVGFCSQDQYLDIPAATQSGPGEATAYINLAPTNWSFQEHPSSTWKPGGSNPGLPRIQNPTMPVADVA